MYEENDESLVILLDEDGEEHPFECLDIIEMDGNTYACLVPYMEEIEDEDEMMEVVVPAAKAQGYQPDCWYSPNAVDNIGRPWPYMIFENLKKLRIPSVAEAIKVGDTVADIQEGLNAGMISVGVIEGSSVMGLSQAEYEALSQAGKEAACRKARNVFEAAHATCVLQNMQELPQLIRQLQEGQ